MTISIERDDNSSGSVTEAALARGLQLAQVEIDGDIARSGAARRVTSGALAEVGLAPQPRLRWLALAATLVIAAGLGGLVEATRQQSATATSVVFLDPLTFGAVAVDQ